MTPAADTVVIARRFNGPPDTANGGYACGVVAEAVDAPAVTVSLRVPPPLDVPLRRERRADGTVVLTLDGALVAEGAPAELDLEPPPAPALAEAEAATARYPGHEAHTFPTCFVCGPERLDDGMRVFPGPLAPDGEVIASPWVPESDDPRLVWSALDCPSAFVCSFDNVAVLARLTARIDAPVAPGRPHVAAAWPLGRDGRKHRSASAIYGPAGAVIAVAEALWIELRPR